MADTLTVEAPARSRLVGLDGLRGLAIVLMVADHAAVALGLEPMVLWRLTVTRAALPLFCIVAGSLIAEQVNRPAFIGSRRCWQLIGAGTLAVALGQPLGIGQPDVLLVFCLALAAGRYCGHPVVLALAAIQPFTWPINAGTGGYEPGTLIVLVGVGVAIVNRDQLAAVGSRLTGRWLQALGRHPVKLYVGHLAVLAGLVAVLDA